MKFKKYNWLPDIPDNRDKLYVSMPTDIPDKVDLRPFCPVVENQGSLGSCHDYMTEVLTNKGWCKFLDLVGDELLATVNPETSELSYEKPTRIVQFLYSGDMICAETQKLNFKVTPDHNMLVRKWNTDTKTLNDTYDFVSAGKLGWYSGLMSNIQWEGSNKEISTYTLKGIPSCKRIIQREDKLINLAIWLQFLGIYIAEGTMIKRNQYKNGTLSYKIQLAAFKEREKEFIRNILTALEIKYLELKDRFTFENRQIYENMSMLGLEGIKATYKFVPDFIFDLPNNMILEFLKGHFAGDGSEQNGFKSHYTSSTKLADDLQRLIFLSGSESKISIRKANITIMKNGSLVIPNFDEHRVSICEKQNASIDKKENIFIEQYHGPVFCAEVPSYHTLITRRNKKILISGNCTGNAIVGALEILINKNKKTFVDLSRLFVYYNERVMERTVNIDAGAIIRDGIKTIAVSGVCTELLWPYDIVKFRKKPTAKCYVEATKRRITSYSRLITFEDKLNCLASGFPFVFGFSVYDSFETADVAKSGTMVMPTKDEKFLGGHAVCAVGYDKIKQVFIVRNSWGPEWGDAGYFYMPFEYVANNNLSDDFWKIQR